MNIKAEIRHVKVGTLVKLCPNGRLYERRPADRETGRYQLIRADGLGDQKWVRGERKVYVSITK